MMEGKGRPAGMGRKLVGDEGEGIKKMREEKENGVKGEWG